MGRVELNCGNGTKGAHVISFEPLMKPIAETLPLCNRDNCPLLKGLDEVFQEVAT